MDIIKAPSSIIAEVFVEDEIIQYKLVEVARVAFEFEHTLSSLAVPVGFVTDLTSVPKICGIYELLKECSVVAPTFHDFIYRTPTVRMTKEEADELFYRLLLHEGVDEIKALAMYKGVSLFGASSYKERI